MIEEKLMIDIARLQSCILVEAVKVYCLTYVLGPRRGEVFGIGLVPEGKDEAETYEELKKMGLDIKFVYRATPPQWN